jgi:hypothetical protein
MLFWFVTYRFMVLSRGPPIVETKELLIHNVGRRDEDPYLSYFPQTYISVKNSSDLDCAAENFHPS